MPLRAAAVKAGAKRAAKRRGSKSKSTKSALNPVAKRRGKVFTGSSLTIQALRRRNEQGKAAQKAPNRELEGERRRRERVKSPSKSKRVYTDSKDPRITYSGPRPGKSRLSLKQRQKVRGK